jgi:hypothetical protein
VLIFSRSFFDVLQFFSLSESPHPGKDIYKITESTKPSFMFFNTPHALDVPTRSDELKGGEDGLLASDSFLAASENGLVMRTVRINDQEGSRRGNPMGQIGWRCTIPGAGTELEWKSTTLYSQDPLLRTGIPTL